MKPIRLLGITTSLLLFAGSAWAQTTVFTAGVLRHQYWTSDNPNGVQHPSRVQVENGQAGLPATDTIDLAIWDTNLAGALNYTERVSGLFIAPVTTNYVFWCNSDDDDDLFLSTDATPANKRIVAQEGGWSNVDQWHGVGSGGATTASQKRSDKWSPDGGLTVPFAKGIPLVAGQKYWIEGVHQQGGGGENFAATYSYIGGAEPVDGVQSALSASNNVIGYGYTIPAVLPVVAQVTNVTAYVGKEASFTYLIGDPIPDPLNYQWFRNGSPITNATFYQYTILTTAADNNAQFTCVVTLPLSYSNNLASTSSVATLTLNMASVSYTNGVKMERFQGATARSVVENDTTGPANTIRVSTEDSSASPLDYTGFEDNTAGGGTDWTDRASGWFLPPVTTNYVFFITTDDDGDLFLSTDNSPLNKTLIAQDSTWGNPREWNTANGGGITNPADPNIFLKRSDQWTNDLGVAPFAAGIALTAGTPYYIEAIHHNGAAGGENLGVTYKFVGAPDPTNGAPPIPASQLSLLTSPTTSLTFKTQPNSLSLFEGSVAVFTNSAISDSEFVVLYQWRRNGTNIAGATTSTYTLTTILADNGAQFDVIAATEEGGLSITSSPPATLTVQAAVFEPGLALMQYWINQTDASPEGNPPVQPPATFQMAVPAFEAGVNNENGDQYVNEVSGFFIPATTGTYDFIVTGDDFIDLFLSTDSNPNNKRLICQEPTWSNQLTWGTDQGGGNGLVQKHSVTWVNASGAVPWANGFALTAGTKYYLEMWHHEGTGGDSCAATFTLRTGGVVGPTPADGTDSAITGSLLGFNTPAAHSINFTQQPTNETVISGNTATFSALGVSDGKLAIGTTGQFQTSTTAGATNFLSFPNVLFQWYRNGAAIPGATTSSYTTASLKPTDGAQFAVQIRALGIANWATSSIATLTVITDTNPPTILGSGTFQEQGLAVVSVTFSKVMDFASISDLTHYTVGGINPVGIIIDTNDMRHVQLQFNTPPTPPVSVTVSGITDFSGNAVVNPTVNAIAPGLENLDIGDATAAIGQAGFIGWPGAMYVDGTNAYTITCEGSDIWDVSDGFNFSYETKTGDFDAVVRQISFTKVDQNSKGGLMIREDTTGGSREWNIVNDPTSADGVTSVDGNGTGANAVECNCRTTNGLASFAFDTGARPVPTYPNAWVRIKRTGQTLTMFVSSNEVDWVERAFTDVSTNANGPLPAAMLVGICCTSHANDAFTATVIKDIYTGSFANYNSSFVASTNAGPPKISVAHAGTTVTITYTGTLQSATTVNGAYSDVTGAASPYTVPVSAAPEKFYRTH